MVLQERDESLTERRQQLRVLNKSGRAMYFAGETTAGDRQRISQHLTAVNERWNAVSDGRVVFRTRQLAAFCLPVDLITACLLLFTITGHVIMLGRASAVFIIIIIITIIIFCPRHLRYRGRGKK